MSTLLDVTAALLLLTGAALCLLVAVGLVRFPDTLCRLHATSKAQPLGLLLVLLGTALQLPPGYAAALVPVMLFHLVTAPVTAQVIGRTAYRTGAVDTRGLVRDELAERLVGEGGEAPR